MIDDVEHKYLFLFALLSLKNKNISNIFNFLLSANTFLDSTTSFSSTQFKKILFFAQAFKAKKSKHWSKTTINETNIQFKIFFRIRKSNSLRNFNYYIVLKNVFVEEINSFYETFTISIIKKKRSHRDYFLIELRFYY